MSPNNAKPWTLTHLLPERLGAAALAGLGAYMMVTAIGVAVTAALWLILNPLTPPGTPMTQLPAYAMTVPFHPLMNLLVWPFFAAVYLSRSNAGFREAVKLGAFWLVATVAIDLVGWVIVRRPWSMTAREFYVGYQPWISFIYLVIFASPLLAQLWLRRSRARNLYHRTGRDQARGVAR